MKDKIKEVTNYIRMRAAYDELNIDMSSEEDVALNELFDLVRYIWRVYNTL